jgi:hypothetical protein
MVIYAALMLESEYATEMWLRFYQTTRRHEADGISVQSSPVQLIFRHLSVTEAVTDKRHVIFGNSGRACMRFITYRTEGLTAARRY